MKRGAFIVFEGIDRCGKTTQSLKLTDNLKWVFGDIEDKIVKHMRFPGTIKQEVFNSNLQDRTTDTGKVIDSYLRCAGDVEDHAIHLLFSANRWEAK